MHAVVQRGIVRRYCSVFGKIDCPADALGAFSVYDGEVTRRALIVNPVHEGAAININIAASADGVSSAG